MLHIEEIGKMWGYIENTVTISNIELIVEHWKNVMIHWKVTILSIERTVKTFLMLERIAKMLINLYVIFPLFSSALHKYSSFVEQQCEEYKIIILNIFNFGLIKVKQNILTFIYNHFICTKCNNILFNLRRNRNPFLRMFLGSA